MRDGQGDLLIGLDLGTSGVVAGVFDATGALCGLAEASYDVTVRELGAATVAEQDPQLWWEATVAALRAATASCDQHRLRAVCVGGQGPSLVAVDARGRPTASSLIWMDTRAAAMEAQLAQSGGTPGAGLTLVAKALWLEHNDPRRARDTAHYLQSWDYIALRLCGVPFASSPWDGPAVAASGLPAGRFPPFVPCATVAGTLTTAAHQATGLPVGLPVVAGTNDSIMGLIGCGATERGRGAALGGTSGGFAVAWDATPGAWRPPPGTYPEPPGLRFFGDATAASGRILDWCLAATGRASAATGGWEDEAAAIPPGADGLLMLPYLAGERAPFRDPQARGVYFGLALNHTPAHLLRAALEGVALSVRHVMEATITQGAQVHEVRVFGGQARSALWNRIKADATNRPVLVPQVVEAGALGGAIVAAAGVGLYPSIWAAAAAMVRIAARIEPDPRAAAVYDQAFAIYRELYPRLRDLFPLLQGAMAGPITSSGGQG